MTEIGRADSIARQQYHKAIENGVLELEIPFEIANYIIGLHIAASPDDPPGGSFNDDGRSIKWSFSDDGGTIIFIDCGKTGAPKKKGKRLSLKEAALYVNERLTRPWLNPKSSFESNVYRGKILVSRHGRENNKRTFTMGELDRFIKARNESPAPAGGQPQIDLSAYADLFGYHSDSYIADKAQCSPSTVVRYRKKHGIPSYFKAAQARIEAVKDRLGNEPAGKIAKDIRVNRMTLVRWMAKRNIAPYARS